MMFFLKTPKCETRNIPKSQKTDWRDKKEEEIKLKRKIQDEAKITIQEFLKHRQQEVEELKIQNQVIKNERQLNAPIDSEVVSIGKIMVNHSE